MELQAINANFDIIDVIENYNSLIWTDRYGECGDFKLTLPKNTEYLSTLKDTVYFKLSSSEETMFYEDFEEKDEITITGRSLSSVLERRIIEDYGIPSTNTLTGLLGFLVQQNISEFAPMAERQVPGLYVVSTIPDGFTNPTSFESVKYGENLYTAVKNLASIYDLGFRIVNPPRAKIMNFGFTYGKDLTVGTRKVIFAESLDNIQDVRRYKSDKTLKNVAVVNLPPWDPSIQGVGEIWRVSKNGAVPTGLNRREVWTDASELRRDETFNADNKPARATSWGYLQLANYPSANAIDFQIASKIDFKIGVDYNLGDIVPVLDSSGELLKHRVTEYIQSFGPEGNAEYPTLKAI